MGVFCRMTTVRRADLSCVVQAGGLSSRMGCDKARMLFCGELLIERVWGVESSAEDNNVEAYVSFLRKKMRFLGSKACIETIRKAGYRFAADGAAA